ncbi:GLN phosphoribosyl pyrophosphate amidotransferase 2 [Actinidia rufa]|uniref:GLN phosphoribosyl pyrophosphate amidotransferase 2 n=1 Tax=Actinidia rufa TaxID=165716 RepID=A0A7J0FP36_9ERIC|nr:GLN phosphoribosyl pyrophosphate amidotransferase 2 [Actinidia rufa]
MLKNVQPFVARCRFGPVGVVHNGNLSRWAFGEILATVALVDCDVVIAMPDSGVVAALGYAAKAGIKEAGAKEVHMRIASPLIIGSCYYGVGTPSPVELISNRMHVEEIREFIGSDSLAIILLHIPSPEELISNRMNVEEIRDFIGLDSLAFLPFDSLTKLLGSDSNNYCYACFSGKYLIAPTGKVKRVGDFVDDGVTGNLESINGGWL